MGETIEYDTVAYQVKITTVKRTSVGLNGLTVNRSQKYPLAWPTKYVTQ